MKDIIKLAEEVEADYNYFINTTKGKYLVDKIEESIDRNYTFEKEDKPYDKFLKADLGESVIGANIHDSSTGKN